MKKLTGTSLAIALTLSCGAASAMENPLEDKDLAFAFGSENTMAVATLSEQEMKETEGAAAPLGLAAQTGLYTVGSGLGAVVVYGWNSYNTGSQMTWSGAGTAFGSGATAGFWGSPLLQKVSPWLRAPGAAFGAGAWYNGW